MPASTAPRGWFPVHERFGASATSGSGWRSSPRCRSPSSRSSRPQGITAIVRSPGVDIVLLMDGSTSMRVRDMGTDRWQRAMQWVRTLTKTLSWNGDRMALATFADIAVPQVRLTRDPNTILFFLDHLDDAPTFRLENETSWNTNVEDAIYWGVKLVETDQEMYGRSKNARTFVVISDGQVWSGNVQRAITAAAQRGISVDVIGVGTSNGGMIPLPRDDKGRGAGGLRADQVGSRSRRRFARSRAPATASISRSAPPPTSRSRRASFRTPRAARATSRSTKRSTSCTGICWPPPRAVVGGGAAVREAARAARLRLRRRAGAARADFQPALVDDLKVGSTSGDHEGAYSSRRSPEF